MAACIAHMVWALQFATIRAFLKRFNRERIMAATHAALGRRSFSFGDSHLGTCSISIKSAFPRLYGTNAVLASNARIGV
jgi:hypothetical protein